MRWRKTIHVARIAASGALLGAVVAGVTVGWVGHDTAEIARSVGAALGAVAGIAATSMHLFQSA